MTLTEALTIVALDLACSVAFVFCAIGLVVSLSALHKAGMWRAVRRHIKAQGGGR